jgi:tetratricopeptide (TPR) repeat protein
MARLHLPLLAALACSCAQAHPEIDEGLQRLNAAIAARPADADLLIERGELYARHEDWVSAEANYLRAAELAPAHPRLPIARGALELAAGRPRDATRLMDEFLSTQPRNVEALVIRARARALLSDRAGAAADYTAALATSSQPYPELYLERAAVLEPAAAVRSLDEGMARLGPALVLQMRAVALEESLGRIDAAAARLDQIASVSERKEGWLRRRGDLLARAGRLQEARVSYAAALAALQTLPDWLRASPEVMRLATDLQRLSTP